MAPSPDIATLLRQKQLLDQLNQITSQGTQTDLLPQQKVQVQPNKQQLVAPTSGGTTSSNPISDALANAPGVAQARSLSQDISNAMARGLGKVFGGGAAPAPTPQVAQAAPINGVQQQAPSPTLIQRSDPTSAMTGGSTPITPEMIQQMQKLYNPNLQ